mmetsp:Transcript_77969/g.215580  ORF Transcript_77969/g.215580 Transcript_77969/m.215580 type:complete len:196 (-) Transcript_77969:148-735(-)
MRAAAVTVVAMAALAIVTGSRLSRKDRGPDAASDGTAAKLEALQPVLQKLQGLDPKTFGLLSGMLNQAQGDQPRKESFLQYLQEDPEDVQAKLQKLGPVLDRLKGLDPKAFGLLNGLVHQEQQPEPPQDAGKRAVAGPSHAASLLQEEPEPSADAEAQRKLEALQPVLEKLKGLDGKAFGMLSNMMAQATGQKSS